MAIILIVDDEEPVRDFLAQVFSDAGHPCIQAVHGGQALELMEKERPDLVLADVMMPVLSGADLCRQTKASSDRRSIPVILMSSAGRRSADGTGADAFIPKPFDLDHIEALVQRWLAPQPSRQAHKTPE